MADVVRVVAGGFAGIDALLGGVWILQAFYDVCVDEALLIGAAPQLVVRGVRVNARAAGGDVLAVRPAGRCQDEAGLAAIGQMVVLELHAADGQPVLVADVQAVVRAASHREAERFDAARARA